MERATKRWLILVILLMAVVTAKATGANLPAWYVTTTRLNVRLAPNTNAYKLGTFDKGTRVEIYRIDYTTVPLRFEVSK